MGLFTHQELRGAGLAMKSDNYRVKTKGFQQVLKEDASALPLGKSFDIFLSHSYFDALEILALKEMIENTGYSVYVDWIVDKQMSRKDVTAATAETLRARMKRCDCLFLVTLSSSPESKWMPWELGFFDGLKGKVAILPISYAETYSYIGQEYLGLYYYVTHGPSTEETHMLWVHETETKYVSLDAWLKHGTSPCQR